MTTFTLCEPDCPAGQTYDCTPDTSCPVTCDNPTGAGPCADPGEPSCRCPSGKVQAADMSCQDPLQTCPCYDDQGNTRDVGSTSVHSTLVFIGD